MTTVHERAPRQIVLLSYRGPTDVLCVQPTTDVRITIEVSSSSSVTDVCSGSSANLREAIARFAENVRASEIWLDTTNQVLRRIDQHATAVASKGLFSDRISQYLQTDERIYQSISEFAIKLLSGIIETEQEHDDEDEQLFASAGYIQKLRYEIVLNDTLLSAGFESTSPYTDQKGGLVVDYFRNSDRITLVFSENDVHVLTYVSEQFINKIFSPANVSQIDVREFLEDLLLAT